MTPSTTIDEITFLRDSLFSTVSQPIQFPEPSLKLNIEARAGSKDRIFKHVHQSCVLHREHFAAASQIKHLYLLDAYIEMTRQANPLGIYMAARSMLELNASLNYVSEQLHKSAQLARTDWLEGGRQFFNLIVRARFATSRADLQKLLQEAGLEPANCTPWPIRSYIQGLEAKELFADAGTRYGELCDHVHHNLGSTTTANAGSAAADVAFSSGGGMIFMSPGGSVTQYEYPIPRKGAISSERTAVLFLRDARACVRWINDMPSSPYHPDAVRAITGNHLVW